MKWKTFCCLFCSGAILALEATWIGAAEHTIEMFQSSFLPQAVEVNPGDTVKWVWRRGVHTATSGLPDGLPGTPDEPGAIFDAVVDEANPVFSHTFEEPRPGGFPFFDREHPSQIGFVQISSGEISLRVAVVDNIFNPQEAFIFEGDSIRWEHEMNEDFHTITSGLSSLPEDDPGLLFDEESSDLNPIFSYRFDATGSYPYFCIPHEFMGMNGIVQVQTRFVRGDTTGEGRVDLSDAISTLNFLFLGAAARCCDDAFDANDDAVVN